MKRELTKQICITLCYFPLDFRSNISSFQIWKRHRDALLIRMIYLFSIPISNLLDINISDINFHDNSIKLTTPVTIGLFTILNGDDKGKKKIFQESILFFDNTTRDIMIKYLDGRKRGSLFLSSRKSKLSVREAERIINHYATKCGIQSIIKTSRDGRELRAVTIKNLQDAGVRHTQEKVGNFIDIFSVDEIEKRMKEFRMQHPLFIIKRL